MSVAAVVDMPVDDPGPPRCEITGAGDRAFTVPDDLAALARDPDEGQIRAGLRCLATQWTSHDAAVVFVTGHGGVVNGAHWTALKGSSAHQLAATGFHTADLIYMLAATEIEHLLLIIDTCFAGAIAKETANLDDPLPASWLILTSASKDETATAGTLTKAIGRAAKKLRDRRGEKYGLENRYF